MTAKFKDSLAKNADRDDRGEHRQHKHLSPNVHVWIARLARVQHFTEGIN